MKIFKTLNAFFSKQHFRKRSVDFRKIYPIWNFNLLFYTPMALAGSRIAYFL